MHPSSLMDIGEVQDTASLPVGAEATFLANIKTKKQTNKNLYSTHPSLLGHNVHCSPTRFSKKLTQASEIVSVQPPGSNLSKAQHRQISQLQNARYFGCLLTPPYS